MENVKEIEEKCEKDMTMEEKRLQIVDLANEILERIEDNPYFDNDDLNFIIDNIKVLNNIADTMKDTRFYVEFGSKDDEYSYFFQTEWFETEKEAQEFASKISYVDDNYFIRIMCADFTCDEPGDIEIYKQIK